MPNQSFFHLTPHHDHQCITPAQLADQAHEDFLDDLTMDERKVVVEASIALGNHLLEAIDTYCEAHDLSFGIVIEALRYMRWHIEREQHAPDEDDLDA